MLQDPLVSEVFERRPRSSGSIALIAASAFIAVGICWVIITDIVTYHVIDDHTLLARVQTTIDSVFIVLTGVGLYIVARTAAAHHARARALIVAIVDSIGDGLILVGPERTIVFANHAAEAMLGSDDLVGLGATEFAHRFKVSRPDGTLVLPEELVSQRAFDEPVSRSAKEVITVAGRDRELVIVATGAPVPNPEGQPTQLVVSVMHDITDNERFEAMRDQFMTAAAHYLKTPVAIIKANVQYLARTAPRHDPSLLDMMQRQCERIDGLVQNLFVLARARSNSLELHARDMELAPLVRTIARDLSDARDTQVTIEAHPHVRGDRERLAIVARNLSQDALRHSVPRSVVRVNLDATEHEAQIRVAYVPLSVTAQPFEGALEYDDTRLSRYATDTIIKAHGGHTGAQVAGKQAELWVTLPILRGAA
jgi:signal transduction histidine kinase